MEVPLQRDIDLIIERLTTDIPCIQIDQIKVVHPGADDDGLWFIHVPDQTNEVQLESSHGSCPFLVESDFSDERFHAHSIEEAVRIVKRLYGLA
jgi:hypothetical protein